MAKKGIISNRPMTEREAQLFIAKKLLEETKGKKGKELAKKIANVGKPKGKAKIGTEFKGYPPRVESVDVYKSVYTEAQLKKLLKAKSEVSQMRADRTRTYTRASAAAKKESKKK